MLSSLSLVLPRFWQPLRKKSWRRFYYKICQSRQAEKSASSMPYLHSRTNTMSCYHACAYHSREVGGRITNSMSSYHTSAYHSREACGRTTNTISCIIYVHPTIKRLRGTVLHPWHPLIIISTTLCTPLVPRSWLSAVLVLWMIFSSSKSSLILPLRWMNRISWRRF